jgi:5'(3')-deoxyribonucleotidase
VTIYCDMDGVLSFWEKARDNLVGTDASKNAQWRAIDKAGKKFWAGMPPFDWSHDFWETLRRTDETVILSSPSLDPDSCSGKLAWLQDFTKSRGFRDYIFTNQKWRLAKSGDPAVLIDDKEKHVDAFTRNGGIGILFPRTYNRARADADNPVKKVLETLSHIYPGRVEI